MTDVADRTEHTGTMTEPNASETTTPDGVRGRRIARWIAVAVLGAVSVVAILFSIDYGLGTLLAFAALFTLLGFTVPALLLMLLWLRMFGRLSWLKAALLAAAGAIALFMLFDVVLGVPMPRDLLMTPLTSWM